jgi:hypothetical protein
MVLAILNKYSGQKQAENFPLVFRQQEGYTLCIEPLFGFKHSNFTLKNI